ncbi:Chloride channel protein 2 [Entamoeba marina]
MTTQKWTPIIQDPDNFEIVQVADLEDDLDTKDLLVKITTEPTPESTPRPPIKQSKLLKLLKKIFLFQVFGYRGTLVHVVVFYLILLGGLSAVTGFLMDITAEKIFWLKSYVVDLVDSLFYQIPIWVAFTFIFTTISFLITKFISKAAIGSGVPDVKCVLLGNEVEGILSFKTLITKIFGLTLAAGSGMWVGKEGPTIHIASCIAAQLVHLPIFHFLRASRDMLMQVISIGTGCGVTANFGTPLGGLLFSVEVTSTYYPVRNYWFGTFSAVVAALTFRSLYNVYIGNKALFTTMMAIDYSFDEVDYEDFILSITVGIICGVLGMLFVHLVSYIFHSKEYLRKYKLGRFPYIYLIVIILITTLITAPYHGMNPLAYPTYQTIQFLIDDDVLDPICGEYVMAILLVMVVARFIITAFSISLPIPAGLFSTTIVIGCIIGRFVGELLVYFEIVNDLGPGGFAIIGGSCFVGAVTQTFSSAVIMVELTGSFQLLLPTLASTIVAVSISRFFTLGAFDRIMVDRGLPFVPDIQYSSNQTAETVMDEDLVAVPEYTNFVELKEIVDNFKTAPDGILPVVDTLDNGILLGDIKLSTIRKILDGGIPDSVAGRFLLDYSESPIHLLKNTQLSEVHMLFVAAAIDSAFVTENGRLVGQINKKMPF